LHYHSPAHQVSLIHRWSGRMMRIIRLGKNSRILTNFVKDLNIRNNYGLIRCTSVGNISNKFHSSWLHCNWTTTCSHLVDDAADEAVSNLLITASCSLKPNSRRTLGTVFSPTTPACRVTSSLVSVMLKHTETCSEWINNNKCNAGRRQ